MTHADRFLTAAIVSGVAVVVASVAVLWWLMVL